MYRIVTMASQRMTRIFALLIAVANLLAAAEPFRPEFACKPEDLQAAGLACSDAEPCPIYLEIASIWASGSKIRLAGNIHSAANTLSSILLSSDDGGVTWLEPTPRFPGTELDKIQFLGTGKGWIGGQRVYPLPGDPFLLLTDDGGGSWRRVDVLEEGSNGYIQQLWFDSPTTGSLVIDQGAAAENHLRYVRYETSNGGTAWMVKESNEKPFQVGPTVPVENGWRVQGDSKQKLLLIQKKDGSRWITATTLPLELTQCRSPEVKEETEPTENGPAATEQKPDAPLKELIVGGASAKPKPKKKPPQ